jgi:hypothetical protein
MTQAPISALRATDLALLFTTRAGVVGQHPASARHRVSAMLMVVTALFVVVTTLELPEIFLKR